jgi:hypothetical protein
MGRRLAGLLTRRGLGPALASAALGAGARSSGDRSSIQPGGRFASSQRSAPRPARSGVARSLGHVPHQRGRSMVEARRWSPDFVAKAVSIRSGSTCRACSSAYKKSSQEAGGEEGFRPNFSAAVAFCLWLLLH